MPKKETFEASMARLEAVVRELEQGDTTLERSMVLFEEGTKLSTALSKQLDEAEQKVAKLVKSQDGEWIEQPHEEG